ncbi:hypothetical protein Pla52o_02040 [Novipirellula galeiformis]|uniref:Class I SAM-dependent methyltransferase n=1 Tax=Novipirellula galeiformis TaxID=2528004 RepID=A0A5C6CSF3_9BACT|nr:class I SAM-dependent methyltransferase [Novipirellula galeiformis]TWU26351.1 hypothetical protein Pla52o_02040 [Novipirellula galeiformis]
MLTTIFAITGTILSVVVGVALQRKSRQWKGRLRDLEADRTELREAVSQLSHRVENQSSAPTLQTCMQRLDCLEHEARKPSVFAKYHPERLRLSDEVLTRMTPIHEQLDRVLFPHEQPLDDLDWMHKLKNKAFPYSLTDEEGLMLYKVIADNQLKSGYEIATAFGYSSFYLGMAFQATGGSLLSVDAYIEEAEEDFQYTEERAREHAESLRAALKNGTESDIPEGLRFARWGAEQLGIANIIDYQVGFSPLHVDELTQGREFDFAFIDGGHFGEQPVKDVESILGRLNPNRFVMAFHDTQCEAVAKAVHFACAKLSVPRITLRTRNQVVFLCRGIDTSALTRYQELTIRQTA